MKKRVYNPFSMEKNVKNLKNKEIYFLIMVYPILSTLTFQPLNSKL
jgi:hypothetical protein